MDEFLKRIVKEAGAIGLATAQKGFSIEVKSDPRDLLAEADTKINDFLVSAIREEYTDHKITSEEGGYDVENAEYEWIIDPVDGTYNFAHTSPLWAVVVGVLKNGISLYSAIYFPAMDQLFFADEQHSYLNEKKLVVSSQQSIEKAAAIPLVFKPFGPYGVAYDVFRTAKIAYVEKYNSKVFSYASPYDFMAIATGMADFVFSNAGLVWDRIPHIHICKNAGATVTDMEGNPWNRDRQDVVISATKQLHQQVLELFES